MDALAPRPPFPINARLVEPLRGAAALGYRSHREWHLVIVRQPGWQSQMSLTGAPLTAAPTKVATVTTATSALPEINA